MNFYRFLLFLFTTVSVSAQVVVEQDTIKMGYVLKDTDTISEPIELPEIIVMHEKMSPDERKAWLLLQNRVYKVYPYAKIAAEKLTMLNTNMAALKTNREKKKYFKIVEDYMENEFEAKLKKLSRKQGQILVKLVYRQTGRTTFDLIKDLKSGWKAFWYNNTGKVFDVDIKRKYSPYENNEDYLIETILVRAFSHGRLIEQKAANPVNYDDLSDYWENQSLQKRSN